MGRLLQSESDSKSHLIKQICDVSNHTVSCVHNSKSFIDWYLLLQVEDNAGVDVIRKRYHKYALQLHPDKNKHPNAEFAFKLVSEAYACLSDDARRSTFDLKRSNNICSKCVKTPPIKTNVKTSSPSKRLMKSKKISAKVKEIKARFMEEARVMNECLKVFDKEMPVFDPNDYVTQGYPHFRVRRCNKPDRLWCLQSKGKCNSPIFECKSNR